MSNRDDRHKLFDRFSRELATLKPDAADRYCCPLCLKLFDRSEVDELLTLEHVIPNRLGKRLPALTCKRCNNDVGGAQLDSHLHRKVAFDSFLKGAGKSLHVELNLADHRVAANWERTVGKKGVENTLRIVRKASAPTAIQETEIALRAMSIGSEFQVRVRLPAERRAQLALVKSGYLLAFLLLGYRFIFSNHLKLVRQQLQEPLLELLPLDAVLIGVSDLTEANSVILVTKPAEVPGILAVLEVSEPPSGSAYWGVLLPHPASPPDFFDRAQRLRQSGVSLQVSGQRLTR